MAARLAAALFAASVSLAPAAEAHADEAPVARPQLVPGDRWTYRRTNYAESRDRGEYELRVTFAGDKGIVAIATERNGRESETVWTADWNAVVAPNGDTFVPDAATFRFPLAVGGTFDSRSEMRRPHARGLRVRFERAGRVVGWEEVEVPAGRFRALRVEVEGAWQRLDVAAAGRSRTTMWYVPAVKRWVKYLYEDEGTGSRFGEELVRFSPGG